MRFLGAFLLEYVKESFRRVSDFVYCTVQVKEEKQLRKQQCPHISDPYALFPNLCAPFYNFPSVVILREPVTFSYLFLSLSSFLNFLYSDLCPSCRSAWHFNHDILEPKTISKPHPSQLAARVESFSLCHSIIFFYVKFLNV